MQETSLFRHPLWIRALILLVSGCATTVAIVSGHIDYSPLLAAALFVALACLFLASFCNRWQGWLLVADIFVLDLWLYAIGGLQSGFASLLLLPLVTAAATLNATRIGLIWFLVTASYALLLWLPQLQANNHQMRSHLHAMGINFVIISLLSTLIVASMARRIRQLAHYREQQLRDEQLLVLGSAAAQLSHDLATPLGTLQLLHEELQQQYPGDTCIAEMEAPLRQCHEHLAYYRQVAENLRNQTPRLIAVGNLLNQLQRQALLLFPHMNLNIKNHLSSKHAVHDDGLLLSVLLNLVRNAFEASSQNNSNDVAVTATAQQNRLQLVIQDQGKGIAPQLLSLLGNKPVPSQEGLGVSLMLSNATVERLGGKLEIQHRNHNGCNVIVYLPLFV